MRYNKTTNIKIIENITIEKLGHGGIGIATHTDGRKILIKGGPLPKSIVDIRVIKSKSDHIEGHITKIHFIAEEYSDGEILCPHYIYSPKDQKNIQDSKAEIDPRPPQKTGCGGCKRQIVNYNKQLLIKKQLVEESFDIINKKTQIYISDNLDASKRNEFRNIYLEAAQNEPNAFGPVDINYKIASQKTDQERIDKLTNPVRQNILLIDNNKVVGLMICGPRFDEKGKNTNIGGIRSLYINKFYRNKGRAKKMMDVCISNLYQKYNINQTRLQVAKSETGAINFYEKYGFTNTKEITNFDEGYLFQGYEMEYIQKSDNNIDIYNIDNDIGEQNNIKTLNPIPSPKIWGYRNKIEFSFGKYISAGERLSEWSLGFHKQGEFAKIVDIDVCYLIDTLANNIYTYAKNLLLQSGYDVYDQKFHRGVFRHLMLRQGQNTGENMLVLIISDKFLPSPNDKLRIKEIIKNNEFLIKNVSTMIIGTNNGLGDIMFSPDTVLDVLRGDGYIYEKLNILDQNLKFKISPQSFFQTNTSGAELLFQTAINMLSDKLLDKNGLIIDLYCGAGTIGLSLLAGNICNNIIGIDIVESSIQDANTNALQNMLSDKSKFYCGKAEDLVKSIKNIDNLTAIIIDPPRDGLHPNVINFLIDVKKKYNYQLLYISCNPVTMARDINMMLQAFKITQVQPLDMFPHTHHIECIGLLS